MKVYSLLILLIFTFNHLASAELYLDNFEESLQYNEATLAIYQDRNDRFYTAQVYNDIGNTHFYLGNYEEAITYLDQCIELSKAVEAIAWEAPPLLRLNPLLVCFPIPYRHQHQGKAPDQKLLQKELVVIAALYGQ